MLKAIDAFVSLTKKDNKSIEERKELFINIFSINDNSLTDFLNRESGWLLSLLSDSLKSAGNFSYYSSVLERLFKKLKVTVNIKDIRTLELNLVELVSIAIDFLNKDDTNSSIAVLDVLEYILQILHKVFLILFFIFFFFFRNFPIKNN